VFPGVDLVSLPLGLVIDVHGHDYGNAEFHHLDGEIEFASEIGRVHRVHYHVGFVMDEVVSGYHLLLGIRA